MKCPKCGEEMSSGICLKCGYIQTYENLDDAFSQYTNYASDLKSSDPEDLFKTAEVPQTPPLIGSDPFPKTEWEAHDLPQTPELPETPPLPEPDPLPKTEWEAHEADPSPAVPEPLTAPDSDPFPKTEWETDVSSPAPDVPETPAAPAAPEPEPEKPKEQPAPAAFVRLCPKCGRPLHGRFCGGCGYDSGSRDIPSGPRICPVCGHETKGAYCGHCGRDLRGQSERLTNWNNTPSSAKPASGGYTSYSSPKTTDTTPKKKWVAFILCLFFGVFGIHRMYVGKWGSGIVCLFLCGLWGIWPLIDLILILMNRFTDNNGKPLQS